MTDSPNIEPEACVEELLGSIYDSDSAVSTSSSKMKQTPTLIQSQIGGKSKYVEHISSLSFDNENRLSKLDSGHLIPNQLTLGNLPVSILLHVLSYLPSKDLVLNVSLVCRKFAHLIEDPFLWRSRLTQKYRKPYPLVPISDELFDDVNFWQDAAVGQEVVTERWVKGQYRVKHFKEEHFAEIDSVWLSTNTKFAFTGGRDRQIILWDLYGSAQPRKFLGHAGWVWSLAGLNGEDNYLVSASWDNTVKLWEVERNECFLTHKLESAVLSLTQFESRPNIVYYSLFNRFIGSFDSRAPVESKVDISKSDHRRSVLCLQTYQENYLLSGGEDTSIKCFDVRTNAMVYQNPSKLNIILSMHCNDDFLLASSRNGKIFCLDPKNLSVSTVLRDGHDKKVTCVQYDSGCVISGSEDHTVKVIEPCVGGSAVKTFDVHTQSVSDLSLKKGVLVSASSDQTMVAYLPDDVALNNQL